VKRRGGEEAGWVRSSENRPIRTPTLSDCAEGHADGSASASSRTVLRSRRPQSTPRYFLHQNRETSPASQTTGTGGRRLRPHGPHARWGGVALRRSTDELFEPRRNIVGGKGQESNPSPDSRPLMKTRGASHPLPCGEGKAVGRARASAYIAPTAAVASRPESW